MQIAKLARNLCIVLLAALSLCACRDGGDAGLAAAASGAAGAESSAPTLEWSAAQVIAEETDSGSVFACGKDGQLIFAWDETYQEGEFSRTWSYSRQYTPGKGWSEKRVVDPGFNLYAVKPSANSKGWLALGWTEQVVWCQFRLSVKTFKPDGGWSSPAVIGEVSLVAPGITPQINLAMDENGNILAFWYWFDETGWYIDYNYYSVSSGWQGQRRLQTGTEHEYLQTECPKPVFLKDGSALALWSQTTTDNHAVWSSRFRPGTGFEKPQALMQAPGYCYGYCALDAYNGGSEVLALWYHVEDGTGGIWSSRYSVASGAWGAAERLSQGVQYCPQLAFLSETRALAAWYDEDRYGTWLAGFDKVQGWQSPKFFTSGSAKEIEQFIGDRKGNIYTLWRQQEAGAHQAYVARYSEAQGWTAPSLVVSGMTDMEWAQLGLDSNGRAFVVWDKKNATGYRSYKTMISWLAEP